jgi:hypothetical protein
MDFNQALELITNNIDSNLTQIFVYDSMFHEGFFQINKIEKNEPHYYLFFYTYNYQDDVMFAQSLFSLDSTNLQELLYTIYNLTKHEMIFYCRINDLIYKDENDFNNRNRETEASLLITNQLATCVVCNENNKVLTSCNHNVCRLCFNKCSKKIFCASCEQYDSCRIYCPICRKMLKTTCCYVIN